MPNTNSQTDNFEKIGNSLAYHGKKNDRIYLMKIDVNDCANLIPKIEILTKKNNYSKIFAKVPESVDGFFRNEAYVQEAYVPNFYKGTEAACFFSKFFSEERSKSEHSKLIFDVIKVSQTKANEQIPAYLTVGLCIKQMKKEDAPQMARLYKEVFKSYPFPIFDENYIIQTMSEHVDYFGIYIGRKLIALSSSEMDIENQNTEMTDFATLPEFRGSNLSLHLLATMEPIAKSKGIKTAYTIARSVSYGMNITFARMGYEFAGTLINNTFISSSIESMNVWYKPL